jgi:hypothetical protein
MTATAGEKTARELRREKGCRKARKNDRKTKMLRLIGRRKPAKARQR